MDRRRYTRIGRARELIVAALKQGIVLDTEEADTILGYLESHDYCLMADDQGMTAGSFIQRIWRYSARRSKNA